MLAAEHRAGNPAGADPIVGRPDDVREASICALSGMRANPWCPSKKTEWVRSDEEGVPCSWHHASDDGLLTVYPPEYRAWARTVEPPRATAARVTPHDSQTASTPVAIASPPSGAVYSIDPTLRREFQALSLRAVTASPTSVTWTVDGRQFGTASSERSLSWPLAVGPHRIEARDADGRSAETTIVVR
jgi:membrane carboxypeptidase/penicillin-binding protein PbpC